MAGTVISVLCPSRGNPQLLALSAKSLKDTADGPFEFLVAADEDDPVTVKEASRLADVTVVSPRLGYGKLHEYYQRLTDVARGDWLLVWNDDFTMLTSGWDTVIAELPASVLVADIQSPHSPLCCAPAVRRSAVEAIGTFSSANPHVDTFWQDAGGELGVIRRVPVRIDLKTPVKPGQTHGFYDPPHQAQMAACTEVLRNHMLTVPRSS
jgi:hypothetical protein